MSHFNFFSSLKRTLSTRSQRSQRRPSRHRARPRLEHLEDRFVPATLQVGAGATMPYHTIQAAVDAATSGDTILVDAGNYSEQVTIDVVDRHLAGTTF